MSLSEHAILTDYLIPPASFPTILSLAQFTLLFPASVRFNPQVKHLYRDLQFLRKVGVDLIRQNIDRECQQGQRMKKELLRALRMDVINGHEYGEYHDREIDIDVQLFGPTGNLPRRDRGHNVDTVLQEMERACQALQVDADRTEAEAGRIFGNMSETINGLSDLRYGKFARMPGTEESGVEGEVKEALAGLEDACERKS